VPVVWNYNGIPHVYYAVWKPIQWTRYRSGAMLGRPIETLRPYPSSSSSSFRRSRARIIADDAACLEEIDLNPARTAEAIVEESHETISHLDQEPETTTNTTSTTMLLQVNEDSLSSPEPSYSGILPQDLPSKRTLRSTGTTYNHCRMFS
jgi:hypothetical protein